MMISRNADLDLPAFLYETDWQTYKSVLYPLIDTDHPIDMAGICDPSKQGTPACTGQPIDRSIVDHLYAFFALLLEGTKGTDSSPQPGRFQAVASFDYPINASTASTFKLSPVNLPLTLRLPTPVTFAEPPKTNDAYLVEMANHVEAWLKTNQMTPTDRPALWQDCAIRFDVSLFAGDSQTGQPILRLRNVLLNCANIKL